MYRLSVPLMQRRLASTVGKHIWEINTPEDGHVHDKKPFKYLCKEGRAYNWCSCGWSRNQPFCDGTHKRTQLKIQNRPVRFDCTETKEYWFCNCKHTSTRPFCDGTHKQERVRNKESTIKSDH